MFRRRKKGEQEKEELDICKRSVDTLALIRGELLVFSGETRRPRILKKVWTLKSLLLSSKEVTFSTQAHTMSENLGPEAEFKINYGCGNVLFSPKPSVSAPKSRLYHLLEFVG